MYLFVLIILVLLAYSTFDKHYRFVRPFNIKLISVCQLFLAISIVLAHLSQYLHESWLRPFTTCGGWAVAIFFFISGYGLYYSLVHKKNYLQGFLYKRLVKILIPFLLYTFGYILLWCLVDTNLHGKEFAWSNLKLFTLPYSWFVLSIILYYILFYISFTITANRNISTFVIFLGVITHESYRLWAECNPNTFFAGMCFPLGLLVCKHENVIERYIQTRNNITLLLVIALTAFVAICTYNNFGKIYSAVSFYILVRLIPGRKTIRSLKELITRIGLNKISYEIYLTQGLSFLFLRNKYVYIQSPLFYICLCIAISLIFAGGGYLTLRVITKHLKI